MIKSIELKNWKTHKSTRIEFKKGVNVILGVMGAGKSTILDAISYALFGSFPDLSSKRTSINGIITNRPSEEDNAEVKLAFELDGNEYVVKRNIALNSSSIALLEKNGKHMQTQPERVTESIEELLKVNYDTFSRAIYAQQNRIDYFLDLSKGERKKSIDNMLGLDAFAIAEENSTSLVNSIRSSIKDEEETLASINVQEFKTQRDKLHEERKEIESQQSALEKSEKELKASMEKTSAELERAKAEYTKKMKLDNEIANLKSRIETLSKEVAKIGQLKITEAVIKEEEETKKALQTIQKELEALKNKERKCIKELSDSEVELKHILEEIKERDKLSKEVTEPELKKIEKLLNESSKELEASKSSDISYKSQLSEAKKWLAELREHLSTCPLCERELSNEMRQTLIKGKEVQVDQLNKEQEKLADIIKKRERDSKELDTQLKELNKKFDKLKDYKDLESRHKKSKELNELSVKAEKEITKIIDEKSKALESLSEKIRHLELNVDKIKRKDTYNKEINESNTILAGKAKIAESLKVNEKSIYEMQDRFTGISSKLSDVASKRESNGKFIANIEKQIKEKDESITSFNRIEDRIKTKRSTLANMNKFKSALIETEALLRNRLVNSLNSIMQSIWPELYPYEDYAKIKLEAKRDDYLLQANVVVNGNESWQPIDAIASGGERSIASLTMRIALSMVIVPNLRWIILDEPTHNIDSNGIEKLIDVLSNSLPNVVEQVFVITHDDALKQISNAAIYQLERDKNVHGFTSVSKM